MVKQMVKQMVEDYILEALQREYSFKPGVDVYAIDFIKEGYMNSLAIVQFVVELEDEFGIEFTDDELASPDFKVVGKLIKLVEKKAAKD